MTTVKIEMYGSTITATVDADSMVSISVDGVWAGDGIWEGQIVDCAAQFGSDVQTDEVYDALDEALQDAIDDAGKADERG